METTTLKRLAAGAALIAALAVTSPAMAWTPPSSVADSTQAVAAPLTGAVASSAVPAPAVAVADVGDASSEAVAGFKIMLTWLALLTSAPLSISLCQWMLGRRARRGNRSPLDAGALLQ